MGLDFSACETYTNFVHISLRPRFDVATNTFRLPYFHRNSASEFLACIYGKGLGRSDDFQPGGGSFEGGHTPHGGFHEGYQHGMRIHESQPEKILTGTGRQNLFPLLSLIILDQLTIMIESSRLFLFTEYARKDCGVMDEHGTDYRVWEALPVSTHGLYLLLDYN